MKAPKPDDPRRSALMARVRQRGTAPELAVAAILRSLGLAYRLNVRSLPGSPDFANKHRRWAIFVMGCYWHHHTACRSATVPKTNEAFWRGKFAANRLRDARAVRSLRAAGYRVLLVWECEVDAPDDLRRRLQRSLNRVA
ncbi:very short patch repair endonuclease [Methyloraptor flagellatus]|uniref:Very short patch repair endonuclease n=2 Tax=Methyloraptor flagellatus TaxID=3162530 RepID=A0AAU7XBI3_9HYPH